MKKLFLFSTVGLFSALLETTSAYAQIEWTSEQKAVWATETAITDAWLKGDWQAGMVYYDESYQGWPNNSPIPIPKDNMEKSMSFSNTQGGKLLFWDAIPLVIWVNGNFAYTDYYYRAVWQDKDGKKSNEHGRWLDVLMKKNGKWVLVGDHGGEEHEPSK